MSYVESNLLPNEKIIYAWAIHSFYNMMLFMWLLVGIFLTFSLSSSSIGNSPFAPFILFWLWIIFQSIYSLMYNATTEIVVTDKRVIYKTGIIARNIFELQLSKVESAVLDQTIFQRIIGAWFLKISWTGWHSKPIKYIANPQGMRTVIYEQIEKK